MPQGLTKTQFAVKNHKKSAKGKRLAMTPGIKSGPSGAILVAPDLLLVVAAGVLVVVVDGVPVVVVAVSVGLCDADCVDAGEICETNY